MRACLLIHGFGESSCSWREYGAALTGYDEVYAVDLRGHGESSRDPSAHYGMSTFVGDLAYIVEALKLTDIVIVGHSLGGDVALALAALYPGKIRAVVLVDFAPELNSIGLQKICADLKANLRVFASRAEFADALLRGRPLLSPEIAEQLSYDMLEERAGGGWAMKLDPAFGEFEPADLERLMQCEVARENLRSLPCPLLLVRGTMSSLLSRDVAGRYVREARHGVLREVRAGHAVMQDNPSEFLAATRAFFDALPAVRA